MIKKVFIKDLAFYINAESNYGLEKLRTYFNINNHIISKEEKYADYIIINTFGYFDDISDKVIEYIRYLKEKYNKKIIIFGELIGISDKIDSLDVFEKIKIKEGFKLDKIFLNNIGYDLITSKNIEQSKVINPSDFHISYNINIIDGCSNDCSYCIMYKGTSKIKSKPLIKIIEEVKYALSLSYIQINLVGVELGNYGEDIGTSFDVLFNKICEIDGFYKIRIEHLYPLNFIKLYPLIKGNIDKISSIFTPVVSFNNKSLTKLNRNYEFEEFYNVLLDVKKNNENIILENLILYGIPGETFNDFIKNFNYNNIFNRTVFRRYDKGYDRNFKGLGSVDIEKKELFIKKLIKLNKEKYDLDKGVPFDLFKKSL